MLWLRKGALLLCLVCAFAVVACHQSSDGAAVEPAKAPWTDWYRLVGANDADEAFRLLTEQRRSIPALRPFRKGPGIAKEKAVQEASELLKQQSRPGAALSALKPPVDWGANPNKDRHAHASRNGLRAAQPLFWAHFATGDPKYLDAARAILIDWTRFNLVDDKPNPMKWYDLASGERAAHLAYVIDRELRSQHPARDALAELVWAADIHATQLSDPKMFTIGNHGLYPLVGLKALTTALPTLRNAGKNAAYADEKMSLLLRTRYTKEGFHKEHSAEYQEITNKAVRGILATGLFAGARGIEALVSRAERVDYELYHPNGDRLLINDSEIGFRRLAGTKAQRDFLESEGKKGEAPPTGLLLHEESGYAFFRSSWSEKPFSAHSYLFFAPAYHSAHHKQADHLSFEWSEAGQPILVDSGKFDFANNQWRRFFVSTRAGNAVEIDEKDYTTAHRHAWGSGLSGGGSSGDLQFMQAAVEHYGFDTRQRRTLVLAPRHWLCVIDDLESKRAHDYRQWFHFHPAFDVEKRATGFVGTAKDKKLSVFVTALGSPKGAQLELVKGQTRPRLQGWISPRRRKKYPRASVAFHQNGERARFVTLFSLAHAPVRPRVIPQGDAVRVQFALGGRSFGFVLDDTRVDSL